MRQIKFRCWDKEEEYFSSILAGNILSAIHGSGDPLSDTEIERYVLQQYTGLKDKNGVEIYEGDILYRSQADSYWKVEYQTEEAAFILVDEHNESWGFLALRHNSEIVGNIFENQELLKQ